MADRIRPGTHLACMGTDTRGRQEIDPALSVSIGAAQQSVARGAG